MLVLNRDEGEKVLLDTSDGRIVVTVVRNARGRLVLGFEAPPSVAIMREEIARNNPATVKVTSGFDAGVAQLEEQRHMNPVSKGNLSTGQVIASLLRAGKTVLIPFGEGHRYDLVIEDDGRFLKVQCKTGRIKNNAVRFKVCSVCWKTGKSKPYTGQVDLFGVFCPDNGTTYLIPIADTGVRECVLRLGQTRNCQAKNIRWASLYEVL